MAKKSESAEYFDEIIEEAREGYDLRDRLRKVNRRTKKVTLYTDEVAGEELGGVEEQENQFGIKIGQRRWGLRGRLADLQDRLLELDAQDDPDVDEVQQIAEDIEKVRGQIPAALKRLEKSALVFTLRSVPDLIVRDARRKARKHLGIKGKGIPEGREEEFTLELTAQLVSASVDSWEDRAEKRTFTSLTVEEARALKDELDRSQFAKLDAALGELSFESAIANQGTDSADF